MVTRVPTKEKDLLLTREVSGTGYHQEAETAGKTVLVSPVISLDAEESAELPAAGLNGESGLGWLYSLFAFILMLLEVKVQLVLPPGDFWSEKVVCVCGGITLSGSKTSTSCC